MLSAGGRFGLLSVNGWLFCTNVGRKCEPANVWAEEFGVKVAGGGEKEGQNVEKHTDETDSTVLTPS